jgi:DegV family protein with EDD domain
MIRIVTDSNSQLPPDLARRWDIEVAPLTVVIDGQEYHEPDLDPDEFFDLLARKPRPEVSTAAPSPGEMAELYRRLAGEGVDQIVSVHIGSEMSAAVQSARLAAEMLAAEAVGTKAGAPEVHVVDTHAASFIVGCAAWEAAEAVAEGATAAAAAAIASQVAEAASGVFIVGALDLARAGGRFGGSLAGESRSPEPTEPVPVIALIRGQMELIGHAADAAAAAEVMAERVLQSGSGLRVALAVADSESEVLWKGLEQALDGRAEVDELLHYRVGPSVAVHTGAGTAGAVFYRRP